MSISFVNNISYVDITKININDAPLVLYLNSIKQLIIVNFKYNFKYKFINFKYELVIYKFMIYV